MEDIIDIILLGAVPDKNVLDWFNITEKMFDEIRGYADLQPVPKTKYDMYDWLWNACHGRKRVKAIELLEASGFDLTPINFGFYMRNLEIEGLEKYRTGIGFAYKIDEIKLKEWFENI
jgi:hypothetical protein